uniref:Uncharacterized protein n=1 Tax=Candidatus Kentrum sp. FW TaxID=2126338 RepID=A0A450T023_9GAMM|nr:MAG: hypothetical protein BECKFW1821A_GA0114235_10946 [Candidatus Kentron sp. FW]
MNFMRKPIVMERTHGAHLDVYLADENKQGYLFHIYTGNYWPLHLNYRLRNSSSPGTYYLKKKNFFPQVRKSIRGIPFWCPGNYRAVLTELYGEDYGTPRRWSHEKSMTLHEKAFDVIRRAYRNIKVRLDSPQRIREIRIRGRSIQNPDYGITLFLYLCACAVLAPYTLRKRHRYMMFHPFYINRLREKEVSSGFSIADRINIGPDDKKIVSCSLYGDAEKYISGCLANAERFPEVFPGWKLRVYCHHQIDEKIIHRLADNGCQVVIVEENIEKRRDGSFTIQGMFWRFLPLAEDVICMVQDVDHEVNTLQYTIANHWLDHEATDKPFFRMILPIPFPWPKSHITGMNWGFRGPVIPDIHDKILQHPCRVKHGADELFLRKQVFPVAVEKGLVSYINRDGTIIWKICPNHRDYRRADRLVEYVY